MFRLTLVFVMSLCATAFAQTQPTGKTLKDSLKPAVKNGGFAMPDQILWCSSVIKVGDTYHMFASRWPAQYGLGGWTKYSECVRATSKDLLGPYEFQEVVLQKRPDNWDNTRIHNVKIVKAGDKFVLYHIDTANETGYAVADAVTGPWKRHVNRGVAFEAKTYEGTYKPIASGDNLLPNDNELEDPTIWWANNQYNVLLNDWKGKATSIGKAGAQYFSKDGNHFKLMNSEPVFTKKVV